MVEPGASGRVRIQMGQASRPVTAHMKECVAYNALVQILDGEASEA